MKKLIFAGLLLSPSFVFANVRINEIAWMGTVNSSTDEWIELYNDGDALVDLTGWSLSISTKKLEGNIPAKGYFLLERTDDSTVPNIPADHIYTGSLNDTGVRLSLSSADGLEVSVIDATAGWEKGNKDTKETMQWDGGNWITAEATPRIANRTVDTSGASETGDASNSGTSETDSSSSSSFDTSAHVSPFPLSEFTQKQELFISAGRDRIVAAGNPVSFEAFAVDAKGVKNPGISAVWSFGDGSQSFGIKTTHIYSYPGEYVVVLNVNASGKEAVSRAEVRVFAPKVSILPEEGGAVSLANESAYEVNVGGWKIAAPVGTFSPASDTIIKTGKKIIFPKTVTGVDFSASDSMDLFAPNTFVVSRYIKDQKPIAMIAATAPLEIPVTADIAVKKYIEPEIRAVPVVHKTQTVSAALAVPEKEKKEEVLPTQKIVIKKQEGFFSKMWNLFF